MTIIKSLTTILIQYSSIITLITKAVDYKTCGVNIFGRTFSKIIVKSHNSYQTLKSILILIIVSITVKPLMFACPLFREFRVPNKTAQLKGANINCRRKIGWNYYSISNYMVLIRQNKGANTILHVKSPTFRAAKLKGFTVCKKKPVHLHNGTWCWCQDK